eukprot:TRINITY_DN22567_c0_g1_i1.p1 TRINITY_DN22567_c0_g1~~TRINITY_DN22567_c0_g1_i1.p1  ORF type:complete len:167 (+),score=52.04 TRINITY_DN22567_c0_g1_i1:49-501(+)
MAKLTLILALAVFGACLATPVRNRRKPHGARSQQRFSSQFHDKFIYGHDDEPDYNDDHTSNQFGHDFQQEYNNRTPYKLQGKPEEENKPAITEKFIDENLQGNNFGNFEDGKATEGVSKNAEDEQKEENPSLREFTLIISKLLFHLSQMQ